jgi:hypothetical protein
MKNMNFAAHYAKYVTLDADGNLKSWTPEDKVISIERLYDTIFKTTEYVFIYDSGRKRTVREQDLTKDDLQEIAKMQSRWTPKLIDDPKPKRIRCQYCGCLSEKDYGTCEHCGAAL